MSYSIRGIVHRPHEYALCSNDEAIEADYGANGTDVVDKAEIAMAGMSLSHTISVMLPDRPVGVCDVCLGPDILGQPDGVTGAMLVEEFRL